MKQLSPRQAARWIKPTGRALLAATAATLLSGTAFAAPITYTGFTVTDGQLGAWKFHNARVFLTFESDTADVQATSILGTNVSFNPTGTARITILTGDRSEHARFAPGQIFVSYDHDNTGTGFGSYAPDHSVQPAYPLGVSLFGTVEASGSPAEAALPTDLAHDTGMNGHGWVCATFPAPIYSNTLCPAPGAPLSTDKGDLYLYQPYQNEPTPAGNGGYVPGAGFFFADTKTPNEGPPFSLLGRTEDGSPEDITYNLFLISDVALGGETFTNAKIHLSFRSRPSKVAPLSGGGPNAYINEDGIARAIITSGDRTIGATFAPHQIYIYFDPSKQSVGFGSYTGGRAYPASLTQNPSFDAQLVGAVSDIVTTPADASKYTPETASLVTNLQNETVLASFAFSCTGFDPATTACSNPESPAPLSTDKGAFRVYEPYRFGGTVWPFSNNWGMFWSTIGPRGD
nr:hypothetical protein [uncultured Rhodopila sp.]